MFLKNLAVRNNPLPALLFLSGALFLSVLLLTSFKTNPQNVVAAAVKETFMADLEKAITKTELLETELQLLAKKQTTVGKVQDAFREVKLAYKRTEYLTEYTDPELAKKLNGAPLPKVVVSDSDYQSLGLKEPLFVTLPPEGLQVLEELLFGEETPDAAEAYTLAHKLEEQFTRLRDNLERQPLTDKQVLESMREEVLRVMTMGITGFDAPAAGQEMQAAATALEPVLKNLQLFEKNAEGKARTGSKNAILFLQKTITFLQQNPDFETFDRVRFIREFADPAYGKLTALQQNILSQDANSPLTKPVNDLASSLFSPDFLQPNFYAKQDRETPNPDRIALGKMLFFDPVLSSNNQRSCASCHNPDMAFTDGKARSTAFNPTATVGRNSPTLVNSTFSTGYFWDSRAAFLEDQIPEVVNKADELHTNYEEVVQKLNQSEMYRKLFRQAFKTPDNNNLNTSNVNRAIAAYVRSLVSLNSPFDKYMRRETEVLSAEAIRGANLFMGKAACATCHFAPVFNGTVPPRFLETETEVIGVPANADLSKPLPDPDLGRARVVNADAYKQSFKTPTVRNAQLTAPYMHNGIFPTLTEVVEFYNRGGGAGLGLTVPNQTLPSDNLELTEQEKKDLVAFMETLTDQPFIGTAPTKLPRFPENAGLNDRPIGGKY